MNKNSLARKLFGPKNIRAIVIQGHGLPTILTGVQTMNGYSLYTLIYTSKAIKPFSIDELDHLLERARLFNQGHEITGMLVHLSGFFIQALEGPERLVSGLFSGRISNDSRHNQLEVVAKGPIQERKFGEWRMAFNNLDCLEERPEGFSEYLEKGFTTEFSSKNSAVAAAVLNNFKRKFSNIGS